MRVKGVRDERCSRSSICGVWKLIEQQVKPVIEKHLDRAEEIQKKLGKASA